MSELFTATENLVVKEELFEVKSEPPDEPYLFLENYIKEELDIEPTSVEPVDMHYVLRQCKDEPAEKQEPEEALQNLVDLIERPSPATTNRYSALRKQLETTTLLNKTLRQLLHCPYCSKRFYSRNGRSSHIITEHSQCFPTDNQYFCFICKTAWQSNFALSCHMRAHKQIEEKCSICEKIFRTKSGLKKHVNAHCKKKVCFCKLCNKVFSNHTIKLHMLSTHAKVKPFKCSFCQKSFALQCLLSRHLLCHKVTDLKNPTITKICSKTKAHDKQISNKETKKVNDERKLAYGMPATARPDNETKCYGLNLPQKCGICMITFAFNSNFRMHVEQEHQGSMLFI